MSGEKNDVSGRENKSRWTTTKSALEVVSTAFSVLYKFSIGMGALVILIYFASIRFFPALSVSDAVLLVLLAVLFGAVFACVLSYGAISMLWVVAITEWLGVVWGRHRENPTVARRRKLRKLAKKMKKKGATRFSVISKRYRAQRRSRNRSRRPAQSLRPSALRGFPPFLGSVSCFVVFAFLFIEVPDARALLVGAMCAGFYFLLLAGLGLRGVASKSGEEKSKSLGRATKYFVFAIAVSTLIFSMFSSISTPAKMAVEFLGLRKLGTTVEVSEKERHRLSFVSEALALPVIDCRPASEGKLLVHFVDVLWDGVGDKSRLSFEIPRPGKPFFGRQDMRPLRSAALSVDASQTSEVSMKPQLPACIPYSLDRMFHEGSSEFSNSGQRQLESIILVLGHKDSVPRIDIQLAVAGNGMRSQAEQRAKSLVDKLNNGLANSKIVPQINVEIKVGVPLETSMPEADLFVWVGGAPDQ